MWAHARYDLQLSSEEFWEMTPCELYALMDRHRDAMQMQYAAVIQRAQFTSLWMNCNPDIKPEYKKTTPADFIPKMRSRAEATVAKEPEKKPDGSYRMSQWAAYAARTGQK